MISVNELFEAVDELFVEMKRSRPFVGWRRKNERGGRVYADLVKYDIATEMHNHKSSSLALLSIANLLRLGLA